MDWLAGMFRRWLRSRGVSPALSATPHLPREPAPPAQLPAESIDRWFADCLQALLARGRLATAAACMVSSAAEARRLADSHPAIAAYLPANAPWSWPAPEENVPPAKISVIICSNDDGRFAAVSAEYERALAGAPHEIIRIADARSLAEGYNRGLNASAGEIVIFSHHDVRLLSPHFRAELTAALQHYDLVGVAGATELGGPTWLSCAREHRRQLVCYADAICAIDGPEDARWHGGIQCLDGVFLAVRREALGDLRFDAERYDGFHFYDLDFSHRAHLAGLRVGVCPRLGLWHESRGSYADPAWKRYAQVFCEQYGLPMHFEVPSDIHGFASEEQLIAFLATYFACQDRRKTIGLPPPPRAAEQTLLHVGCGNHTKAQAGPGFQGDNWREIRLDADPAVAPDLIGTITDMAAVRSASVDAVFSSHTLEHLYAHEVPVALAEIRRVLRPDGFTVAWVPDLQAAAKLIAEDRLYEVVGVSPHGPIAPFDIVFSQRTLVGRDRPFMAHHCGFTLSTLVAAHYDAGFGSVIAQPRIPGLDLQVLATQAIVPEGLLRALSALHFAD